MIVGVTFKARYMHSALFRRLRWPGTGQACFYSRCNSCQHFGGHWLQVCLDNVSAVHFRGSVVRRGVARHRYAAYRRGLMIIISCYVPHPAWVSYAHTQEENSPEVYGRLHSPCLKTKLKRLSLLMMTVDKHAHPPRALQLAPMRA